MPQAVLPLAIGGALTSAVGAISTGQAQSQEAAFQAQVARNNAVAAQEQANYTVHAGETQAETEGLRGAAAVGHIKAAQAANNIDVNSGSAVDVRKGAATAGQENTETTLNNSLLKAFGYQTSASTYTAQAGLESYAASEIPVGADVGALGSVLSKASSFLPGSKASTLGT